MSSFSNKELLLIEQLCGKDYVTRYLAIQKRKKEQNVRIVNTGMVSSGKSSLYNVLVDSIESEHFPTGAARTTTRANYYDINNISYIDTPGIDVRDEDDALAFSTIMEADIIMMVHNIKTGPLNRSEAEWLQRIVERLNSVEACQSRLVFVCTWKDTRERDEDYINIVNDVKNMVFEIAGTWIPFFDVSVKKYSNGKIKNQPVLCKNSGVEDLRKYLEEYADSYLEKKKEFDRIELKELLEEIQIKMRETKNTNIVKIDEISKKAKQRYKSQRSAWNQVYDFFASKRTKLAEAEKELSNM